MFRPDFRTIDANRILVNWVPMLGAVLVLVVALASCATTKTGTVETIITDSTTLRQVQRLVDVAVPGDSAKLRTRIRYNDATGYFQPVTIYSRSTHGLLVFSLDSLGVATAAMVTDAWVAQVPVTDTELTRRSNHQQREEVPVKAPPSGFVKFSIWFTVLTIVLSLVLLYLKFFTPLRLLK